ncbi:MAG TPA: molybdopterin molybdotransferase MoeA [Thermoplasmata archaeon]|nr:molybdopterin molybdotransferase MoeA [Thermoplasmata archaeon]
MEAHLFDRLVPALEARRRLLAAIRPIDRVETVAVDAAFGRVAAKPVVARGPVPPFARATWDGYALRSRDVRLASRRRPRALRIVGEVFAEQTYRGTLGPGEAVAVATGGAIPAGADALEIFEEVERDGPAVVVRGPVRSGARIAAIGSDVPRGTVLVRRGEVIGPAALGAVAASGVARLTVYAKPIVAVVPNGNELVPPGGRLRPGQIFESNNAALVAFLVACGCEPRPRPPLRDDAPTIERALRGALRSSDLVLATGGSSVGEHDHLPRLFPRIGRLLFHGVAVRPGKPTLAASSGPKLLVGLPGHPTSCLLNMHWLVMPVLRRLARLSGPGWAARPARLAGPSLTPTPGLATVVPLEVRGALVRSTFRGSSATRSLRAAEAFTILPPGRRPVRTGSRLRVFVLDPPLGPPGSG